jgi:hypothetical protein
MKKIYDKLLLMLAFLALLGGVALYLLKSEAATNQKSSLVLQPADNPYQPVPIPNPGVKDATWPEPGHQSSGPNWVYDVFTPPKIYLDAAGNFTPVPPKPIGPPEPFGIYLATLERKPYRIQLQGYSGSRTKPEEAVLFLFDEERQLKFNIRPGQSNDESEVEVLNFKIDRRVYGNSNVEVIATATILNKRSGQQVKLNDNERVYEPEVSVVFRSEQDTDVEVALMIEPADPVTTFETPAGKFVLKEINLEASTVTVEKEATEEREVQIRTLTPARINQPETSKPVAAPTESSDDQNTLESLF